MDLKKSLDRFKQQQQKCHATMSAIAATPSLKQAPRTPPVRFSDDTERLQCINAVRNSHAGAQIKCVIELLYTTRQALTAQQIKEACHVDIYDNNELFQRLSNNPKVKFDGKCFVYKPKHDLKGKDELFCLIRTYPDGLAVEEVKDSYPSVMEDLQTLKAEGHVWWLSSKYSEEDTVYPNDRRAVIEVDDDLKQLFLETELPSDMVDIEKEMKKHGMKPATNVVRRCAMDQVHRTTTPKPKAKKGRRITKRTKLTNAHLPELFKDLGFP